MLVLKEEEGACGGNQQISQDNPADPVPAETVMEGKRDIEKDRETERERERVAIYIYIYML